MKVRGGRKNRYCSKLPATTHQLLSSNLEQERKIDLSRPVYASVQHLGLLGRIFLSPREIYCRVLLPRNGFSEPYASWLTISRIVFFPPIIKMCELCQINGTPAYISPYTTFIVFGLLSKSTPMYHKKSQSRYISSKFLISALQCTSRLKN